MEKSVARTRIPDIGAAAFAVYGFLASSVDSKQRCFPSQGHVARSLGLSRTTVNRAIALLAERDLVAIERPAGGRCRYLLLGDGCGVEEAGLTHAKDRDVEVIDTNNNQREIYISNNSDRAEFLAQELAQALGNPSAIQVYRCYARKYPEELLRRVLAEVKEVPGERIRKSRAHLFNHILKQHE